MVEVHVDDIIVSGGKKVCEKFFAQLKKRFPVKNQGELKMYQVHRLCFRLPLGIRRTRDEPACIILCYAEKLVPQYGISATSNIPGSPGVDLGPRKDGELEDNSHVFLYQPLVGSLMWLSVIEVRATQPYP